MFRLISHRTEDALTEQILTDMWTRRHLAPHYANIGNPVTYTTNNATLYVPSVSRMWVRGMFGRSNR